jgi:DNA-binding transcriptional LysR family regulator
LLTRAALSMALLGQLQRFELDLAFIEGTRGEENFVVCPWGRGEMHVVAAPGHVSASATEIFFGVQP